MVRLENTACPEEAKIIMPARHPPERAAARILGRTLGFCLRFREDEFDRVPVAMRFKSNGTFRPVMRDGIAKKLE